MAVLHRVGPETERVQAIMTHTLGIALLLTAAAMLYKAARGKVLPRTLSANDLDNASRSRHWSLPVVFGAVIGTLVTLTSVGAGAIGVSVLLLLFPLLLLLDLLLTVQVLHSLLQFINDGLLTMHELLGIGLIISPLVLVLVFVNSLLEQ